MGRTSFIIVFVAAVLMHAASVARAQAPESIERALSRVPVTAEMVVMLDGLTVARNMGAVSAVFDMMKDLGVFADVAPNWAAISGLLGWDDVETFDRLLGSRVVLVTADLENTGNTSWAVLSEISTATAERMKDRIPSSPRKAVAGVPIFALERGEYEMVMVRVAPDAAVAERVMLLIGPAQRAQLFDVMASTLSRGATETLAATAVGGEVGMHAAPGVLIAARIDARTAGGAAPARPSWNNFLICTAVPKGRAWECRMTIRDDRLAKHVKRIEPSSDAPYRAMAKGAMLAVLETRVSWDEEDRDADAPTSPFESILEMFTPPDDAAVLLSGRQALAVWPREQASKSEKDEAGGAASPSVCLAFAIETSDVRKMAAIGDKHVARLVKRFERADRASLVNDSATSPAGGVPDFGGVACQAVRSVPLRLHSKNVIRRFFNGEPSVSWSYPPTVTIEDRPSDVETPGWWQVCVMGDGATAADQQPAMQECRTDGGQCVAASHRMVGALVEPAEGGATDRWVSVGMVQPAAWGPFVRLIFPDSDPGLFGGGIAAVFDRIRHAEWRLAARDNGDVTGVVQIEMARDRAKP